LRILSFIKDVDLLSRYPPYLQMIARNVDEFHLCHVKGRLKEESMILHYLKIPKIIHFSSFLLALPTALKAFKICREYGIDLIYVLDGSYYELSGLLTSKLSGIPFVLRLRTNEVRLRSILYKNPVKRVLSNFMTRLAVTNAKRVICLNHELRELVLKWGVKSSNVAIIYHGVDVDRFKPKRVKKPYSEIVLFVGGISSPKGIYVLLKVAEMLKDIHFLLVGPISIKMYEIPNNVHYLGLKPHSDMPKYYNMCDILVLPSYVEAFGDVILEAFATGKPVIASKVGEIPWIVTSKFGWLVEPGNTLQLKEAILDAFLDENRLKAMGQAARKYVNENFKWESYVEKMIENLKSITKCLKH